MRPTPYESTAATASLFIVNPFGAVETISRWFSTHPSTAKRVARLREMAQRTGRMAVSGRSALFMGES